MWSNFAKNSKILFFIINDKFSTAGILHRFFHIFNHRQRVRRYIISINYELYLLSSQYFKIKEIFRTSYAFSDFSFQARRRTIQTFFVQLEVFVVVHATMGMRDKLAVRDRIERSEGKVEKETLR